jgi:uncharacterized protein (DUF2141 family)
MGKYNWLFSALLLLQLPIASSYAPSTFDILISATNIRNEKGTIQIQVYRTKNAFETEEPYKTYRVTKQGKIKGHTLHYTVSGLKKGSYGLALLDDENNKKKMDYGWVLPTEGFGFSDYYHTSWSRPAFNNFDFYLDANKSVTMKVRYL